MSKIKEIILKRKWLFIIIAVIAVIIGIISISNNIKANQNLKKETVKKGSVKEELILSGEVTATEYANLTFPSNGKISYIGVKAGDTVKKGQLLARLDPAAAMAAYRQAENNLRSAQATLAQTYDSVKDHAKDETLTQRVTRTTAEVANDNAFDALTIAKENLENTAIYAPFTGLVTEVTYEFTGASTTYAQSQIKLVNLDTIYFKVTADQTDINKLFVGQKVDVVLDAFSDAPLPGEIKNLSFTPEDSSAETVYRVTVKLADFSSKKGQLRIGMSGDAKFILNEKSDALYLPTQFVNSDTGGKYVNMGRKGNKVYIQTGVEGEEVIEIVSGVKEGDLVVN